MRQDFAAFYDASFSKVFRATLSCTDQEEWAIDATQEAFARALAKWRKVARHPAPEAWVVVTATNLCKSMGRSQRRFGGIHLLPPKDDDSSRSIMRVDLVRALRRLPPRERQVVLLFYLLDLPVPLVADVMSISEGTVKAHLFHARSHLRERLEVGVEQ